MPENDDSANRNLGAQQPFSPSPATGYGHQLAPAEEMADLNGLDSPAQDPVNTTGPIVNDVTPPPAPVVHVSGPLAKLYGSHLKTVLFTALVGTVLVAGGIIALVASKHSSNSQTPTTKDASLTPPDGQTLTINSKLKVTQPTEIASDFTVTGKTNLQGAVTTGSDLTVAGNGTFGGILTAANFSSSSLQVAGSGNFTGTLSVGAITGSSLTITGNGNFSGNVTIGQIVTASSFVGDGSRLTGIPTGSSCTNCAHLNAASAETGSLNLTGNITLDQLHAHGGHITPAANASNVFQVTDAAGGNLLNVDSTTKAITVIDLLPQIAGTYTLGSSGGIVDSQNSAGSDSTGMALGPDGFARIVYDSIDSSTSTDSLNFARCTDSNCTNKVITTVESSTTSNDSYEYAVVIMGHDGFARIAYNTDNGLHLVRCENNDCSTSVDSYIDGAGTGDDAGSYGIGIDITANDLVRLAYANNPISWHTFYAACNDLDCTAPTIKDIDTNAWGYQVVSLALGTDGFARIDYEDGNTGAFKLARCTDTACSTPTITVVDDGSINSNPGCRANIVKMGSDGLPRLLYQDCGADSNIHFIQCLDADCVQSHNQTLENAETTWQAMQMTLGRDGFARILYLDHTTDFLELDTCTNADCSQHTVTELDATRFAGDSGIGAAIGSDGLLRVAYGDDGNTGVKFKRQVTSNWQAVTAGTNVGSGATPFGQLFGLELHANGDSTHALEVQNTLGTDVLNIDAGKQQVAIAGDLSISGGIHFSDGSVQTTAGSAFDQNSFNTFLSNDFVNTFQNSNNVSIGQNALNPQNGTDNVAIGLQALQSNTSGGGNIAAGFGALNSNTTGSQNIALSTYALYSNTTGVQNVALGAYALGSNTSGFSNIAIGFQALRLNATGSQNVAIGDSALQNNTTGTGNVATGAVTLQANTTGFNNTATGLFALADNTTGIDNSATGAYTLQNNTTGVFNTAIGVGGLQYNTTGYENTASGVFALQSNTTGYSNTASGYGTLGLNTGGYDNTATGFLALADNTTGYLNTASGVAALQVNSTGYGNTAGGSNSLTSNTTGSLNTAYGASTLYSNTTGAYNTAIGTNSLSSNTNGGSNAAIGYYSLFSNTTGLENISTGNNALYSNTAGSFNIASGNGALYSLNGGDGNVGLGDEVAENITSGFRNIIIGYQTAENLTSGTNNIILGASINAPSATGSNQLDIGNVLYGDLSAGTAYFKTTSTTAFQVQDASGTPILTVDTSSQTLTVKNVIINGTLTVNGHVITGNTSGSTTATLNGNAGIGGSPACTVGGNDTGGQITLKTGTSGWAAGVQCTINFASSYGSAPHPVITPASGVDTSTVKPYVTSGTGSFTISFIVADTAQHTFTFNYFNAQ